MQINSIRDLVVVARSRRLALGLSQEELARRMGVSRQWVTVFEGGRPRAEFGLVMRLLHELDLRLDILSYDEEREHSTSGSVDLDVLLSEYRKA
ncbi:MAG: helix-turn-helix domain-containing protein [Solirubrobacteraceae bacterium]